MINIFKSLWRCKRSVVKVANEEGNSALIIPTNTTEIKKMGMKTFRVMGVVIDEDTKKSDATVMVENEHLSNLDVCDLQDLLRDTYGKALSDKGRAFAQAKANAAAPAAS